MEIKIPNIDSIINLEAKTKKRSLILCETGSILHICLDDGEKEEAVICLNKQQAVNLRNSLSFLIDNGILDDE